MLRENGRAATSGDPNAVGTTMFDDHYEGTTKAPWKVTASAEDKKNPAIQEDHQQVVVFPPEEDTPDRYIAPRTAKVGR